MMIRLGRGRPATLWSRALAFLAFSAPAAELMRGPYLQSGTPSSVIVCWRTDTPTDSRVRYGTNPDNLNRNVVDTTQTTEHRVLVTGLMPDTTYYYSIGGNLETFASGPEYFFVTTPIAPKPTRIWALGDAGTADSNQEAVRDAYYSFTGNRHTDLWLMLGDNAYNTGRDSEYQAAVFEMYPQMLRKSVLWPTLGNHDTAFSYNPPSNLPYFNIFNLPTAGEAGGEPSGTEKYYSFNYGNIHFICIDSMASDRSSNGPMCTWLTTDLIENTREWIIAFWHHPPYTKGSHDSDDPFGSDWELVEMRENVLPILEAYGVDLVLSGHSHSYERSFLLNGHYGYSGDLVPEIMIMDSGSGRESGTGAYRKGGEDGPGAVYIVAGSSGRTSGGSLDHPAMFISLNELGSLVLDIDGPRLDATFVRETGAIDDTFTLLKEGATGRPMITTVNVTAGVLTLTWTSDPGRTYYVERAVSLYSPEWEAISPPILATAPTTTWIAPIEPGPFLFYRITHFNN